MEPNIPKSSSSKRLTGYSFLVVFANDHTIDERELRLLEKIALEDGILDEDEKAVLSRLFSRVSEETVTPTVWAEIVRFRQEQGIA